MTRPAINIVGQTFGQLKVIERVANPLTREATFRCQCRCGAFRDVKGSRLRLGVVSSCGCTSARTPVTDMTGQVFGRLVVLARAESLPGLGSARWLCQCECGAKPVVIGTRLRKGSVQSCGCLKAENLKARHLLPKDAPAAEFGQHKTVLGTIIKRSPGTQPGILSVTRHFGGW